MEFKTGDRIVVIKDLTRNFIERIGATGIIVNEEPGATYPFWIEFDDPKFRTSEGSAWCAAELMLSKESNIKRLLNKIDSCD